MPRRQSPQPTKLKRDVSEGHQGISSVSVRGWIHDNPSCISGELHYDQSECRFDAWRLVSCGESVVAGAGFGADGDGVLPRLRSAMTVTGAAAVRVAEATGYPRWLSKPWAPRSCCARACPSYASVLPLPAFQQRTRPSPCYGDGHEGGGDAPMRRRRQWLQVPCGWWPRREPTCPGSAVRMPLWVSCLEREIAMDSPR
jgi:hypothetical protein